MPLLDHESINSKYELLVQVSYATERSQTQGFYSYEKLEQVELPYKERKQMCDFED